MPFRILELLGENHLKAFGRLNDGVPGDFERFSEGSVEVCCEGDAEEGRERGSGGTTWFGGGGRGRVKQARSNFEEDATIGDDGGEEGLETLLEVEVELEEVCLHGFES